MKTIAIELTDAQRLAVSYSHTDIDFFLQSVALGQVNLAIDEIVQITVAKCLEISTPIPNSKEEMVNLAFAQGWVKTAADRQAEQVNYA